MIFMRIQHGTLILLGILALAIPASLACQQPGHDTALLPHNQSIVPSYHTVLGPGSYVFLSADCGAGDRLTWSFSSTGSMVKVLACTDEQYAGTPLTNYHAMLADKSYGASGNFTTPTTDRWGILFYNDAIFSSADLTCYVTHTVVQTTPDLDPGHFSSSDITFIIVLLLSLVAILVAGIVVARHFKKPRETPSTTSNSQEGSRDDSVAILKEKLARSEITEDEFIRKKQLLQT